MTTCDAPFNMSGGVAEALDRVTSPPGEVDREPQTFIERQAAERQRQEQDAAAARRLAHEDPALLVEPDPLRTHAERQRAARRRARRRGRWPR